MKILLVDDHPLFREGVALLLRRLSDDLQILEASTCEQALESCAANADIDVVLLDLNLNGRPELGGLVDFRERVPHVPVVVISSTDDEITVRRAIDHGAMGFIPKSSTSDVMLSALRLVLAKGIYLPPNILGRGADTPFRATTGRYVDRRPASEEGITPRDLGLTARQAEVLRLVLQGKPIKLICRELSLGEGTIKAHVSAVLRALNVTSRTQAIVAAHRLGLRLEDRAPRAGDRT